MFRSLASLVVLLLAAAIFAIPASASWKSIGPYGGDVRSLAADPQHSARVFLGTSDGQIYASTDGGRSWTWWANLSRRSDFVIDHLVIDAADPHVMYAGVWSSETSDGGVYRSEDGGRNWRSLPGIEGHSVRAMAAFARNPRILVAGAMDGVYRTENGGRTWQRLSPADSDEIRNVESVAIDPRNPDVIYAGTWHLPWKTADGGAHWTSIRNGMIDDSDVFSIQVDWSNPQTAYASACSGIYRSQTAGELWRKIQGIPHSARRTRVIRQDPVNPRVIYAGTTEGLWQTESGGESWRRLTGPTVIVNDIVVDPRQPSYIILATDRAGVLVSADMGQTFEAANEGFAHRNVSHTAYDPQTGRLYTSVLNDKEFGGVFYSEDGAKWRQISQGLESRDVYALVYARTNEGGRLLAGLADGLMAFDEAKGTWSRVGKITGAGLPPSERPKSADRSSRSKARGRGSKVEGRRPHVLEHASAPVRPASSSSSGPFTASVNSFFQEAPGKPLYASTDRGLLASEDAGLTWRQLSPPVQPTTTVTAEGRVVMAGVRGGLLVSVNGGGVWFRLYLPTGSAMARVNSLAVAGRSIYAATDLGLFRSVDMGGTWHAKGNGVPIAPVESVRIHPGDPARVYVTSPVSGRVYVSMDGGQTFSAMEEAGLTGVRPRTLEFLGRANRRRLDLLVASGLDGLFVTQLTGTGGGSAVLGSSLVQ